MIHGAHVEFVEKRSPAGKAGIRPGDRVLALNGEPLIDVIDYMFRGADGTVTVDIVQKNGNAVTKVVEKNNGEPLGLTFSEITFDRIQTCINKCIFCFVDQMPSRMRDTLYIKDDDFRLSFLQGCFLTLTNLSPNARKRIALQQLSPLYVSVHTTDPAIRRTMLGHRNAGRIMDDLTYLAAHGITYHTQIVICPGFNDGKGLIRSIRDLAALHPAVLSIALVPVGLTAQRTGLTPLRMMTSAEAKAILAAVAPLQRRFCARYGMPLVYCADEMYLLAGERIPPASQYADYPQIENGVGLVRTLYDSFLKAKRSLPASIARKRTVTLITGVSGSAVLAPIAKRLSKIRNLTVNRAAIPNRFFGEMVTVAGLITGRD
ncbi:MAG: DUF512 domain-containing protein, partial [Spirochaetota bacterium]